MSTYRLPHGDGYTKHADGSVTIFEGGVAVKYTVTQALDALMAFAERHADDARLSPKDTDELRRLCAEVEELHRRMERMAADPVRDNDAFDRLLDQLSVARDRMADYLTCMEIAKEPTP